MSESRESLNIEQFEKLIMRKKEKILLYTLIASFLYAFLFSYLFARNLVFNLLIGIIGMLIGVSILLLMNLLKWY